MSQTYTLGKVAPTPRGAYSSTAQYAPLDIITYSGSSYMVLQSVTGVTPPNATYYQLIAAKGDTGSNGQSPTISVGNVTTGGSTASVENVGTNVNAVFDFNFPEPDTSFFVTATYDSQYDTWEADASAQDVYDAVSNGLVVYAIIKDYFEGGDNIIPLGNVEFDGLFWWARFVKTEEDGAFFYLRLKDGKFGTVVYASTQNIIDDVTSITSPLEVTESNSVGTTYQLNKKFNDINFAFSSGKAINVTLYSSAANSYKITRVTGIASSGSYYYVYAVDTSSGTPTVIEWRSSETNAYPQRTISNSGTSII